MIDPSIFVQSEIDYRISRSRSTRVRKGTSRRGSRNPFARRPAEKSAIDG